MMVRPHVQHHRVLLRGHIDIAVTLKLDHIPATSAHHISTDSAVPSTLRPSVPDTAFATASTSTVVPNPHHYQHLGEAALVVNEAQLITISGNPNGGT